MSPQAQSRYLIMKEILRKIISQNNLHLIDVKPLSGGDINGVFLMECHEGNFVVKLNEAFRFPGMFAAEAKGLRLLRETATFKIPTVISQGEIESHTYLLMEYVSSGQPTSNFWQVFAENLATLHQTTQKEFGLNHDNYIGSLPQQNDYRDTASEFYITQRLEPHFKIASENGFNFKNLDKFFQNISAEIPKEAPSLIHGDLWGGNYIVSENSKPVLIDPAVAYAPREMDIGMMHLFGGFSNEVFEHYNSIFPLQTDWEDRLSLWQLYYLLVHLNLFGSEYLGWIKSVVSKYS